MTTTTPQSLFSLGRLVATPAALDALAISGDNPAALLRRHVRGDWGTVNAEDGRENDVSVAHGWRILSAYALADGTKLWIITEADRSATTLLLPGDY